MPGRGRRAAALPVLAVMASDGVWVTAPTPSAVRTVGDYCRLKYYHYTLWSGIYMMDKNEARLINGIVLVLGAALVRSLYILWYYQLS